MQDEIPERKMVLRTRKNKAMILAAGLGTRLSPLTDHKPKAMVEWQGLPLVDHAIHKLKSAGFRDIIINVHHYASMIMDHVESRDYFGINIVFSHEEEELLDTGGGIAKAAWFLDDGPFLVYNVDILSSIDLRAMMEAHLRIGAIATMAVMERETSRSLLMNEEGLLKGWKDNRSGDCILVDGKEDGLHPIAFSAVHIMETEVFSYFPQKKIFPIMPFYLDLAGKRPVFLHRHDGDDWKDMGRLDAYE